MGIYKNLMPLPLLPRYSPLSLPLVALHTQPGTIQIVSSKFCVFPKFIVTLYSLICTLIEETVNEENKEEDGFSFPGGVVTIH